MVNCCFRSIVKMLTTLALLIVLANSDGATSLADEPTHKVVENILYRPDDGKLTDGMQSRCRLDVRYPANAKGYSTIVWFHGGGLTGGQRSFPQALDRKDVAVVTVSYRLHPDVVAPAYIEDAAAAIAWVFQHIEDVRWFCRSNRRQRSFGGRLSHSDGRL